MTEVTNVLYWISTGLLVPVIALLLFGFIRALLLLGGFFGMYINRLKYTKEQKVLLNKIPQDNAALEKLIALKGNKLFTVHLKRILDGKGNNAVLDKVLSDFELVSEKDLSSSRSLARLGPMVGLMGTLIPMGPALVGLAAGDIASMAQNMQVAFSTTVVGLFVGAIGYVTQLVKQRWYVEDINNLDYVRELNSSKK